MARRLLSFVRAGRVLLALALCVHLLPTAAAFTNGQAATLVLGQPDFTSSNPATTASGMNNPYGIAVDPSSGKVFVADPYNKRVLRFAAGAALVNGAAAEGVLGQPNFTSTITATTASGMAFPTGVAVDNAGRLWVVDHSNNRVLRFDGAASKPNGAAADGVLGQPNFTSTITATTASGMYAPESLEVDSSGRLWVADARNGRVLRFDGAAGKPNGAAADGVLGQPDFTTNASIRPSTASSMLYPADVAVDSAGHVWVADNLNNRVLRFDGAASKPNGAAADGVLGQSGFIIDPFAPGPLPPTTARVMRNPFSVAVDSTGRLWVADVARNRVLRFDGAASKPNGAAADGVLGQPDFTSNGSAITASGMREPDSVAVDRDDNLWVADSSNNRLLRFDSSIKATQVYLPLIIH